MGSEMCIRDRGRSLNKIKKGSRFKSFSKRPSTTLQSSSLNSLLLSAVFEVLIVILAMIFEFLDNLEDRVSLVMNRKAFIELSMVVLATISFVGRDVVGI